MDSYVVERLSRSHGAVLANADLSLRIGAGEVFGLLGPNGAGKTTLVRQLVGLLRPDAGSITLFGQPLERSLAGRSVGYLTQGDAALADVPVGQAISTTARLRGLSTAAARDCRDSLLAELALADLADRPLGALSGGQRRLAAVATVLAGPRPVLVLDEPTTGLDPVARRSVWAALARRRTQDGTTVVLVTHNVLEAEQFLDRVAVLDGGRLIASGTPADLKAAVGDQVALTLVWRGAPPAGDPVVDALAAHAEITGGRWELRMTAARARETLGQLLSGPAYDVLDDVTVTTPSLEDVYLALGGRARDLERV